MECSFLLLKFHALEAVTSDDDGSPWNLLSLTLNP